MDPSGWTVCLPFLTWEVILCEFFFGWVLNFLYPYLSSLFFFSFRLLYISIDSDVQFFYPLSNLVFLLPSFCSRVLEVPFLIFSLCVSSMVAKRDVTFFQVVVVFPRDLPFSAESITFLTVFSPVSSLFLEIPFLLHSDFYAIRTFLTSHVRSVRKNLFSFSRQLFFCSRPHAFLTVSVSSASQ